MENFNNKISRLELENFTCFAKAEMDFSSGINVFIGENGTGKTHILKVLYSMLRKGWIGGDSKEGLKYRVPTNLMEIFKPENRKITRLFRDNKGEKSILMYFAENKNDGLHYFKFFREKDDFRFQASKEFDEKVIDKNLLFLPTHEMLTLYRGFVTAYEKRENSFDGTHYELAKALDLLPLKKQALNENEILLEEFNREIGIEVYKKDGQFYLKFKDGLEVEAPLAAEGLKKLAQMIYLIQNGSLNKDTILFWDEPETNLNPKYIKIVAKFLQVLAKNGVQIFVATHDYLLTYLLSLSAEYPKQDTPPMRFFSLSKGENGTEIESADTIHGIQNNAILDEFADYQELMLGLQIEKLQNA